MGRGFTLISNLAKCSLGIYENAWIRIGENVVINNGTILSARLGIEIGDGTGIGYHCLFLDSDGHPLAPGLPINEGPIRIGSDVWIGSRAIILSGITIGNGAVIGAGAIVTRDVPPYAIVAGNPARLIRYRFPPETIAALEEIAWWDWPADKVERERGAFDLPIGEFIKRFGGETDRADDRGRAAGAAGQD